MTGLRFGRLLVLGVGRRLNNRVKWLCQCDCGNQSFAEGFQLREGRTVSCGCWGIAAAKARFTIHGNARSGSGGRPTPEYTCWKSIRARVFNPNRHNYASYGGRGIKLHEPWADSFEAFLKGVGHRPEGKTSLGRIDNNGHYEPGNVRWEDAMQRNSNTRRSVYLNLNGKWVHVAEATRLLGITRDTARRRLPQWDQ